MFMYIYINRHITSSDGVWVRVWPPMLSLKKLFLSGRNSYSYIYIYIHIHIYIYIYVVYCVCVVDCIFVCRFWQTMKQVFDSHYKTKFLELGLLNKCGILHSHSHSHSHSNSHSHPHSHSHSHSHSLSHTYTHTHNPMGLSSATR